MLVRNSIFILHSPTQWIIFTFSHSLYSMHRAGYITMLGEGLVHTGYQTLVGDQNFPPRKFPPLCSPRFFHPHAKYAVDANLFRLESPILTRAKRATNWNSAGGEVSHQGWKTLGRETSGGERPYHHTGYQTLVYWIFSYKMFWLPKTFFIQGVCFYCTGLLLVGSIPPTNKNKTPWMNKVLGSPTTLYKESYSPSRAYTPRSWYSHAWRGTGVSWTPDACPSWRVPPHPSAPLRRSAPPWGSAARVASANQIIYWNFTSNYRTKNLTKYTKYTAHKETSLS